MVIAHLVHPRRLTLARKLAASSFAWFLLAGALLFYLDGRLRPAQEDLVVDDRVLARILALWQQQMTRPPSDYELGNLVKRWTEEEMLFREAKRLGLDTEDIIVRRRLIQKMQFIAEQARVSQPDDAALKAWFEERREDYRQPQRFTFSQVFFRERPGPGKKAALAAAAGDAWRQLGDASMLRPVWVRQSQRALASEFGAAFADTLAGMAASAEWQGPIQSEFGWHLLRLEAVEESALPSFAAARRQALNDYLFAAKERARQAQLDALGARYQLVWQVSAPEPLAEADPTGQR